MATMTPLERINVAVGMGKPDRVPVVPIIDFFAARYGGINQHEMLFELAKADAALEKTLHDLGMIDGQNLSYAGLGRLMQLIFPTPPILPGVGSEPKDGQFQFVEKTVMDWEEYTQIKERGPMRWILDKMRLSNPGLGNPVGMARALANAGMDIWKVNRSLRRWRRKGVEGMVSCNIVFTPLEYISLFMRSFNDLLLDLFRHPEEVKEGSRALMKTMLLQGMMMVRLSGVKRVFMGGARTSASSLSPKQFEEFALPEWQEMCEYWVGKGITPLLHFDSDWTDFYPLLKHLPRRKCILNLDGSSDIFKAKEVLGDHMCIMGDVPAPMLKLGEPEEVDEYCRRLITEVGEGGGFILSTGCTLPVDAKPENVKAMLASVHRHKPA